MPDSKRDPFTTVVSMSQEKAMALAMPDAVKAVYVGQADPARYQFGARIYLLFQTWTDYNLYLRERAEVLL